MTDSRWLFFNKLNNPDEQLKKVYLQSIVFNHNDLNKMKVSCFDSCLEKNENFVIDKLCMSQCVNLAKKYSKSNYIQERIVLSNDRHFV